MAGQAGSPCRRSRDDHRPPHPRDGISPCTRCTPGTLPKRVTTKRPRPCSSPSTVATTEVHQFADLLFHGSIRDAFTVPSGTLFHGSIRDAFTVPSGTLFHGSIRDAFTVPAGVRFPVPP